MDYWFVGAMRVCINHISREREKREKQVTLLFLSRASEIITTAVLGPESKRHWSTVMRVHLVLGPIRTVLCAEDGALFGKNRHIVATLLLPGGRGFSQAGTVVRTYTTVWGCEVPQCLVGIESLLAR